MPAGFDRNYPEGARREQTRRLAREWHATGAQGVVYRSASLERRGFSYWAWAHHRWSEVAIFVANRAREPVVVRRRADRAWL